MGIFDKRINYKPFEYPEVLDFIDNINRTFWVHSEVDFTADTQDFHSLLNEKEKQAIKKSLLAIAQIEVAVNLFGGIFTTTCQSLSSMVLGVHLPNVNSVTLKLIHDYCLYLATMMILSTSLKFLQSKKVRLFRRGTSTHKI